MSAHFKTKDRDAFHPRPPTSQRDKRRRTFFRKGRGELAPAMDGPGRCIEERPESGNAPDSQGKNSPRIATPLCVGVNDLIDQVREYSEARHEHAMELRDFEKVLRDSYLRLSSQERVEYYARIYDIFSESYDVHMGVQTQHYQAIERVLIFAAPYLRLPLIDLTAGTGEIVRYALNLMDTGGVLQTVSGLAGEAERDGTLSREGMLCQERGSFVNRLSALEYHIPARDDDFNMNKSFWVYVNEVSGKMSGLSREKLGGYSRINHTSYDALELPAHLKGSFRTLLCSQTLHLLSNLDRARLVRSIYNTLAPGGVAVIMEEDPFRISPTPTIAPVSLLIRSVANPIKNKGDLIGLFTNLGFERLETRAVWPIDDDHSMRLYLFRKPEGPSNNLEGNEEDGFVKSLDNLTR